MDNTLNIGTKAFMKKKETEIMEAKFKAKIKTILETGASRDFNGGYMTIKTEFIIVVQKNQAKKLVFDDIKNHTKKQQYME